MTSPPYDNLRKYNGTVDYWSFDKFKVLVRQMWRVMRDGGVIVWNVNDQTVDGGKTGNSFRQALQFIDTGFLLNDTMIWRKKNPMPQVRQPRYAACFEYMFVFSKGRPKTFNPIMRTTSCGGQEYHSTCKNMGGENGRTQKDFVINKESVDYNIWEIAVSQNNTNHPAVFPIEIPLRHIRSWTNKGDLVCDPFSGSGTTALAAIQLERDFVGCEINKEYYAEAQSRIDAELQKPRQMELSL